MATYVNDLRLKEIATGDESGSWGTSTNTNLELIAEAFSFGTEAITTNADTHTTTIADGSTDPGRSLFLKYTGTLDSTCTITIGPNTISKLWFIENATSGSQSIIIKQGSGATITIANGQTKAIYSDGAGSGGAMVDAFQDLSVPDLFIDDDLTFTSDSAVITFGADGDTTLTHTDGSGLTLNSTNKIMFNDASQFIQGSSATVLALGATDEIDLTATLIDINGNADVSGTVTATGTSVFASLDISGDIDVDGTTNLDVVDIDGAVDFASTTAHAGNATFADNAKAIFGAGSDLQIYHDGSNSFISDVGTGNLGIRAENLFLQNADGSENYATATLNGAFTLSYDNSQKLATTATGIDVTGSVVDIVSSATGGTTIELDNTSTGGRNFTLYSSGSGNSFGAGKFALYDADAAAVRMLVDSSGNVGIGTSSPATALEVNGTIGIGRIAGGYTFRETVGGGERASLKSNASNELLFNIGAASEAMRIDSSGNVGIGNATVNTFYDTAVNVYGSGNSVIQFQSSNTGTASGDGFAVGVLNGASTDAYIWNRESSNLLFGTGGAERMRIDSSGNVGIATNLPSEKFTVEGVIRANRVGSPTQYGDFAQDNQGGYISTHRPHASLYENFRFLASNNSGSVERMRIGADGDLLVGGTDIDPGSTGSSANAGTAIGASGYVSVARTGGSAIRAGRIDSDGAIIELFADGSAVGSIGSYVGTHLRIGNGTANVLFVNNTGILPATSSGTESDGILNLGASDRRFNNLHLNNVMYSGSARIATTTANSGGKIQVKTFSGGIFQVFQNSSGSTIGYIGNVSNSQTLYAQTSDERLKENITDSADAGSRIDAIQVRQFDWKGDGIHQDYGMVAQELQTVAPEVVFEPEDTNDMMGVDYSKLVPMLVKEIQSLRARVAQLEQN